MKNRIALCILSVSALAASLLAQAPAAPAPDAPKPAAGRGRGGRGPAVPTGPTPRLPDGKPDFSGVWRPDNNFVGNIARALKQGEEIVLTPAGEKMMKSHQSKDDPEANCLPTGVPRMAPYPWKILTTPDHVFFLFEGNIHSFRQIFLNRSTHPKDPDPTWYGDSIGHWDGDTLVVDTVGYNDRFWFDFAGHPHSEQLHTIERYTRTDLGTLMDEVTIEDPGAYAKPFTLAGRNRLDPKGVLMEYICQENQQDAQHLIGPAAPLQ